MERLNLVIELKSTIFAGKLFQAFITRSQKNEERMLLWHFLNSLSERGGTKFKEFTGINTNKSKHQTRSVSNRLNSRLRRFKRLKRSMYGRLSEHRRSDLRLICGGPMCKQNRI